MSARDASGKDPAAVRSAWYQARPKASKTATRLGISFSRPRAKSQNAAPHPGAFRSALPMSFAINRARSFGSSVARSMAASRRRTSSVPKPDSTVASDALPSVELESSTSDSGATATEAGAPTRREWSRTATTEPTITITRAPAIHRPLRYFDRPSLAVGSGGCLENRWFMALRMSTAMNAAMEIPSPSFGRAGDSIAIGGRCHRW